MFNAARGMSFQKWEEEVVNIFFFLISGFNAMESEERFLSNRIPPSTACCLSSYVAIATTSEGMG